MCESTAYLITDNGEEKVMENVIYMNPTGQGIYLEDILGDNTTVQGAIKEIRLLDHKIIIEPAK